MIHIKLRFDLFVQSDSSLLALFYLWLSEKQTGADWVAFYFELLLFIYGFHYVIFIAVESNMGLFSQMLLDMI